MNTSKIYKFCRHIGPGGVTCPCCALGPLKKTKTALNRAFRRKTRQELRGDDS